MEPYPPRSGQKVNVTLSGKAIGSSCWGGIQSVKNPSGQDIRPSYNNLKPDVSGIIPSGSVITASWQYFAGSYDEKLTVTSLAGRGCNGNFQITYVSPKRNMNLWEE